jgi:hypothetical protein
MYASGCVAGVAGSEQVSDSLTQSETITSSGFERSSGRNFLSKIKIPVFKLALRISYVNLPKQ